MNVRSRIEFALLAPIRRVSRSTETPLLRRQQAAPDDIEVGERRGDLQAMQILDKAAGSTTAMSAGHGSIRSMSERSCARRVVFPYFSNPVSVCCFIDDLV